MALKHLFASLFAVALVAGTLSGCGGDGEEAPVDNMQTSETAEAPVPKKRRRMPNPDAQAATPAPAASPVPARTRAFLARNVAYDKMRTKAMTMVYAGQTKKAMNTFESVQQMRPEDPAVRAWLAAIRKSAKQARDAAPTAQDDFKTASQNLRSGAGPIPGGAPALPAPNLPGGQGAVGGRTGAGGSAGAPAPAASPLEIDPKLVF